MRTAGREALPFVLRVASPDGNLRNFEARAVIDASGTRMLWIIRKERIKSRWPKGKRAGMKTGSALASPDRAAGFDTWTVSGVTAIRPESWARCNSVFSMAMSDNSRRCVPVTSISSPGLRLMPAGETNAGRQQLGQL